MRRDSSTKPRWWSSTPARFTEPEAVDGATAVLITHEHPDHYLADMLRRTDAPGSTIAAVADKIAEEAPDVAERVTVVKPGEKRSTPGIRHHKVVGKKHAVIHPELPHFDNSGYLLDPRRTSPSSTPAKNPPCPVRRSTSCCCR